MLLDGCTAGCRFGRRVVHLRGRPALLGAGHCLGDGQPASSCTAPVPSVAIGLFWSGSIAAAFRRVNSLPEYVPQ